MLLRRDSKQKNSWKGILNQGKNRYEGKFNNGQFHAGKYKKKEGNKKFDV